MDRRTLLWALPAVSITQAKSLFAKPTSGERLANAARAQVGITTGYDPNWTRLRYPGGDVPHTTGVCADVVIRAARDGLGLDLQKLVHEDITANFAAYPAHEVWGSNQPDSNIDHRRVLNLECYFQRARSRLWRASGPVAGDAFPGPLEVGDLVTWLLDARLPHIAIVVSVLPNSISGSRNNDARLVHNIGRGAEESRLSDFSPHRAIAHYRWPASA
jgi:uncharacterized protein YijF (DUF1287 family)